MTMNAPQTNPSQPPTVTRMISDSLLPDQKGPVFWIVGAKHPLADEMTILHMFADDTGVEVYFISADHKNAARDFIPMSRVRLVGEVMSLDVFKEEIDDAESDGDDDPDSLPEDNTPPNGQPSP